MDDDVMRHPSDGDAWKYFDREYPWRVVIRAQHRHLFDPALFTCPNDEGLENEVRVIIENEAYQIQASDNILVPDDIVDIRQLQ